MRPPRTSCGWAAVLMLAPLVASAGSARVLSLKTESGMSGPWLQAALERLLLPQLPSCVPTHGPEAKDTVRQVLRLAIQPDGRVFPADGLSENWLDSGCTMVAMMSIVVPKPKDPPVVDLEVEVKTTATERAAVDGRVLKDLQRFCQLVIKMAKKGPEGERSIAAARMSEDPSLTGAARVALRAVADTNPLDHLTILRAAAKQAGGTFDCPALEPASSADAGQKK